MSCGITPRDSTAGAGITFSASSRSSAIPDEFVLPNRAEVTMERHFLKSYVELLIQTCHRRGIHAMGGMAAQVPIKNDPVANEAGAGKSPPGQTCARCGPGTTEPGWLIRGWCRSRNRFSTKACRSSESDFEQAGRRCISRPRICWRLPRAPSLKRGCAGISTWACNIWKHGCAAWAACRFTT